MVKPAPQTKNLGYFVGKWTTRGAIAPGPWGQGGKFAWNESTKWMTGHFFVIGRWDFQMPAKLGGGGEEVFVMGYDSRHGVYTFEAFSSQGLRVSSKGKLHGGIWIWTSEAFEDGKPVQQKMTMRVFSRKAYTLKFELSYDGKTWMTFMEGKAIKKK
jgi:hypothetical protein